MFITYIKHLKIKWKKRNDFLTEQPNKSFLFKGEEKLAWDMI